VDLLSGDVMSQEEGKLFQALEEVCDEVGGRIRQSNVS
jgi:hypothetical protein